MNNGHGGGGAPRHPQEVRIGSTCPLFCSLSAPLLFTSTYEIHESVRNALQTLDRNALQTLDIRITTFPWRPSILGPSCSQQAQFRSVGARESESLWFTFCR